MNKQTLGTMIASLRKEKGMTQSALAEKMGVTDKAVSKWERDLSCPDVNSIPQLAEILGVSVDELMQMKKSPDRSEKSDEIQMIINTIFKGIGLAMGIAVAVLTVLNQLEMKDAAGMLGIGLACLAVSALREKGE
ncbi:MAG: helix-turn-helix domain-containing protein [Lachnospiraceae bacterium]|nr:helix-turn-helix domain-containing protein [Lachnospiraceae bacterium]